MSKQTDTIAKRLKSDFGIKGETKKHLAKTINRLVKENYTYAPVRHDRFNTVYFYMLIQLSNKIAAQKFTIDLFDDLGLAVPADKRLAPAI